MSIPNIFPAKKFFRIFGHGRWIAVIVLLVLGVLRAIDPLPVEGLRNRSFDFYQKITPRTLSDPLETLIVDIDEASLNELGQWPWPRTLLAEMVVNLMKRGAVVVGFDILFSEKDRLSPSEFVKSNKLIDGDTAYKLNKLPSNDRIFALALKNSRSVLAQSVLYEKALHDEGRAPRKIPHAHRGPDPHLFIRKYPALLRPLAVLESAADGLGMISVEPDSDGVVRRVPMLVSVNKKLYPSLSLEMMRIALGKANRPFVVMSDEKGLKEIALTKRFRIPTDRRGKSWVYFTDENSVKRYLSAVDVIKGRVDDERIKGRFILVGTSATGLSDIRNTPISPVLPGVEVHANIIETILTQSHLARPYDSMGKEIFTALLAGLAVIILVPMLGTALTLGLFLVVIGGLIGYSWFEFSENRTLIDATYPIMSTLVLYLFLSYVGYAETARDRKQVKTAFGQYLSPALLAQVADDPDRLQLGGEMKDMTMMFSDIRGFTTISEQFKNDPQGLTTLINQFLTPMTEIIMQRRGTIDKYMGDCIMAFWNAPVEDTKHVENACNSALEMISALDGVNHSIRRLAEDEGRKYFRLNIGIGVNSGEVVVGNMGSMQRFDYSVLGDAVNLASRLESQSKTYGVGIVVGEDTVRLAGDKYAFLELDRIAVKGKTEAVRIYTLLGNETLVNDASFHALLGVHGEMLKDYSEQEWERGAKLLQECKKLNEYNLKVLYELYQQRFDEYKIDPPPRDWDGIYIATSK